MKNRVIRSSLAIILVLAMVLSMAACGTEAVETVTPTVTPTVAPTTTPTTVPTTAPTTTPEVVVDADEAALEAYGITFPEYTGDDALEYDPAGVEFGFKVDLDNIYQEAYEFNLYKVAVSSTNFEGGSVDTKPVYETDEFNDDTNTNYDAEKFMITANNAGTYTVTYTFKVNAAATEYGYYTSEVIKNAEYVVTKTYEVAKANIELKTASDAFQVGSKINFINSTVTGGDVFVAGSTTEKVLDDYKFSTDITVCDTTVVGEFPLAITIKDSKENVVEAEDIVLENYTVSVKEGTRYVLSKEDVTKVNIVRTMAGVDFNEADKDYATETLDKKYYSAEFSVETIAYWHTLTDGQKVLAAATQIKDGSELDNSAYLVYTMPIDADDVESAEYNLERTDVSSELDAAIKAYLTASTDNAKAVALKALAQLILNIDNEAGDYESNLLYALNVSDYNTAAGVISDGAVTFLTYTSVDDEAGFAYGATGLVNDIYDGLVDKYVGALEAAEDAYVAITYIDATTGVLTQELFNTLSDAMADLDTAYGNLIPAFQLDLVAGTVGYAPTSGKDLYDTASLKNSYAGITAAAEKIAARWSAYVELIESYDFESAYVDNADGDVQATAIAMQVLLGYNFVNETLETYVPTASTDTINDDKSLAAVIFAYDAEYATPELYVEEVFAATADMIDVYLEVQAEVDSIKKDIKNAVVATGTYYSDIVDATDAIGVDFADYAAVATKLAASDHGYVLANAESLNDLYIYVDNVTLYGLFEGTFYEDLTDDGLDEAIVNAFEDIYTDILTGRSTAIDALVDLYD